MRSCIGGLGILGCTAFVWSVLPLQASSSQVVDPRDMPPAETVLVANHPGIPDVVLRHEVLLAEADADLMPRPIYVAVAEDVRQYHVDGALGLVRVFDPHGRHLFDVGANGPEGTQVVDPWIVAILGDRLYVYERRFPQLKVYTLEGEYVEAITVPVTARFDVRSVLLLGDDTVVFAGLSYAPELYGKSIHVFTINEYAHGKGLAYERSFADTPFVDPSVYFAVTGGRVTVDLDGGLLYSQRSPHSLRKYRLDGTEVWRIDDPELLPIATRYYAVSDEGRVEYRHHPLSVGLFVLAEDLYLHQMLFPPEDLIGTNQVPPQGTYRERVYEIVSLRGDEPVRIRVDSLEPLTFATQDKEGNLYGEWDEYRKVPIRSSIGIREQAGIDHEPG